MNWTTIEAAIKAAVEAALADVSGLTVQWANQRLPQPVRPFLMLKRGVVIGLGMDERRDETDLAQPAGEEVLLTIVGRREFSVSMQAYAADVVGADTAGDIMERVKTGLLLESNLERLSAAGLGFIGSGDVRDLPESPTNSWSSRAQMDVRFYATSTATERTGYIETVELTGPAGETFTAPGDPPA